MRCIPAVWSSLLALLPALTWTAGITAGRGSTPPQASGKTSPRLPLFFEANRGQWPEQIRFASHGSSASLSFQRSEIAFNLPANAAGDRTASLRMRFENGARASTPVGVDPQPGKVNYLIGRDSSRWLRHVPIYNGVRYPDLYPGVQLAFHPAEGGAGLEYDFLVAPGAKPDAIRYRFDGLTTPPRVSGSGALVLSTPAGEVRHQRPVCYQEIDGQRHPVPGEYRLAANGEVGFRLGDYDRSRTLVIDPVVVWAVYIQNAGSGNLALDRDPAGNLYIAGQSVGDISPSGLPTTTGAYERFYRGGQTDCFVGSLTPDGSQLRYLTYLGGNDDENDSSLTGRELGPAIAVNPDGFAWVTGSTLSDDFPTMPGAFQLNKPGIGLGQDGELHHNFDAFVTKLSQDGSSLICSSYYGGTGDRPTELNSNDYGVGIGVRQVDGIMPGEHVDQVFVVGTTSSTHFPTMGNVFQPSDPNAVRLKGGIDSNASDVFVMRLDSLGGPEKITYVGAPPGITRDPDTGAEISRFAAVLSVATCMMLEPGRGDVYFAGYTNSAGVFYDPISRFPVGGNAIQIVPGGGYDAFVMILDPELRDFYYSTLLGGTGEDIASCITVNAAGQFAVGGSTGSSGFPVGAGEFLSYLGGPTDGFVTAFKSDLTPAFSTFVGSSQSDQVRGISINSAGTLTAVGITGTGELPLVDNITGTGTKGSGFMTTFDAEGSLTRSSYLAGLGSNGSALASPTPYAVLQVGAKDTYIAGYASHSGAFKTDTVHTYGASSTSGPIFMIRVGDGPPAAPTLATATALSARQIRVQWQDNSTDETGFRVEMRVSGTGSFAEVAQPAANATSVEIGNLTPETTYEFRVRATNGQFSAYSNTATAKTLAPGKISVTPKTVNFGTLKNGKRKQKIIKIKNTGKGPLHFHVGSLTAPFEVPAGDGTLNPKQTLAVGIEATAAGAPGTYTQNLVITSDDPQNPSVTVKVTTKVK